jgi:hypothetical protein
MPARFLMALALGFLFAAPAMAADEPKSDPLAGLIDKLHGEEVAFEGNVNEIPLFEMLQRFSKRHAVTFLINEESFKAAGENDIKTRTPNLSATQLRGLTLHQFLTSVLDSMSATYIVKGKTIEIVAPAYAAKLSKSATSQNEHGRVSLNEPLVSFVAKEKPLNEAVAAIAERYDLTVVVTPQAGDARTGFVTARLLNLPADKAIELLAVQCDLRVVRKGTAFLITSREHAEGLHNEKMERERQKIELEKFRQMPPPRPEAPPPQLKGVLQPGGMGELKFDFIQPKGPIGAPLLLKLDFPPQPKPVPKP